MARLMPDTVKTLALELYDYTLSDEGAAAVAHMVGAIAAQSRRLEQLNLAGLQPHFGYPTLIAQANRLSGRR